MYKRLSVRCECSWERVMDEVQFQYGDPHAKHYFVYTFAPNVLCPWLKAYSVLHFEGLETRCYHSPVCHHGWCQPFPYGLIYRLQAKCIPCVKEDTGQTITGILTLNSEMPATGPTKQNAPFKPEKNSLLGVSHTVPQHLCRLLLCV